MDARCHRFLLVRRRARLRAAIRRLTAAAFVLTAAVAWAEPYAEQSVLEPFTIEDQHGSVHTVDAGVRALLFSRDMDGGAVIREALEEDGAALLERSGAVYISDISGMPWFVRAMIAKPRMRDRSYAMLLDEEGDRTEQFPSVEGKATLMVMDRLRVVRISYIDSPDALRKAIESLAHPG